MDEFFKSLVESWKEKINSPIYGIFLFSVLIWNWEIFYTLFFESSSVLTTPKVDYVQKYFPANLLDSTSNFFSNIAVDVVNFISSTVSIFFIPTAVTVFAIYQLPKIHNIAHRVYLGFKFQRKLEYHKQNLKFQETIAKQKEEEVKVLERKAAAQESIQKQLTDDERWEKEYQEIKKTKHFQDDFWAIKELLINYNGYINELGQIMNSSEAVKILRDYVFLLTSKGILEKEAGAITLTPAGNYIMSRYIEDIQNEGANKHKYTTGLT